MERGRFCKGQDGRYREVSGTLDQNFTSIKTVLVISKAIVTAQSAIWILINNQNFSPAVMRLHMCFSSHGFYNTLIYIT